MAVQMVLELGDTSTVKNVANGLSCEIEFKTKVRVHFRVWSSDTYFH